MHHKCHKEIHARISESEVARVVNTPAVLKAHASLAQFIAWVTKRPPNFVSKTIIKIG